MLVLCHNAGAKSLVSRWFDMKTRNPVAKNARKLNKAKVHKDKKKEEKKRGPKEEIQYEENLKNDTTV